MHNKKFLSNTKFLKSSSKKKMAVFFILLCMVINGFVPSALEISKNSLFLVFMATTHNVISKVFRQCNDSLITLSDKIAKDLQKLLFPAADPNNDMNEKKTSDSKSNENCANDDGTTKYIYELNSSRKLFADIANDKVFDVFVPTDKLFQIYMNYKIALDKDVSYSFLLLFMIFIFAIRQRKYIASDTFIYMWKERISVLLKIKVPRFFLFIIQGVNK